MLAIGLQLNHFWEMVLFALLVSVAFACIGRRTTASRIRYALWSFGLFLLIGVGIAWLMYPFSR